MKRFYRLEDALKHKEKAYALHLYGRNITTFPMEILELSNLKELIISSCVINTLPPEIAQLEKLHHLEIRSSKLNELPKAIGQLSALAVINFSHNQLTTIPEEICQLQNLKSLYLSFNKLESLPKSLGKLQMLTYINCSHNALKKLPESISTLHLLKELHLSNNQLQELPKQLNKLEALTRIRLESNQLTKLPENFGPFPDLLELYLGKNQLTELPENIGASKNIYRFSANNNKIKTIPASLCSNLPLHTLSMDRNEIETLPDTFFECNSLENISLAHNKIKQLPEEGWDQLKVLQTLYLSNNKLETLPRNISKAKLLRYLYINDNPFKEVPLHIFEWEKLWSVALDKAGFSPKLSQYGIVRDFLEGLRKAATPINLRIDMHYILCGDEARMKKMSVPQLVEGLRIKAPNIQENAMLHLLARYKQKFNENPLKKGAQIAVLGDINFKRTEIRQRLKDLELGYSPRIKKTTTHVILGKNVKKHVNSDLPHLIFISDTDLNAFFQQKEDQYLLETSEDQSTNQQNLSALLLQRDPETIEVAFSILRSGGVPKELLTELFLVAKNTKLPQRLRKQAKSYLQLHGSEELKNRLTKNYPIFHRYINERTLSSNLRFYLNKTELKGAVLGRYVYEHTKNGLLFWLSQLDEEGKKEVINELAPQPNFVLRQTFFTDKMEIFKYKNAVSVNLNRAKLSEIPLELCEFSRLQTLVLNFNKLDTLPEAFKKLTNLKKLYIRYNKFKDFPKILEQMPNLKEIYLTSNPLTQKPKNQLNIDESIYDLSSFPYSIKRK